VISLNLMMQDMNKILPAEVYIRDDY
jgi:hypothetical protein